MEITCNKKKSIKKQSFERKTKKYLLLLGILNEPLFAIFAIFPFILRKNLKASLLQISIFTMIKPVMGIFSFYWSSNINKRTDKLRSNLIGSWFLGRICFLLFPFINNSWFLIFASGLYMLFYRASTPALMEILKLNLKKEKRERAFSLFSSANFAVSIILGFIIGLLLDAYPNSWKFLFFISSLVGLISISIQINIPIIGEISNFTYVKKNTSIIEKITTPWINCFALLKKNPAFYNFQKGFMLGGVGLMLIIPASIIFYADILNIKYSTMSNSKLIFMGIGFVLTTPIWRKLISKISINNLTAYLCLGFGLFPYLLFLSKIYIEFLYIAFLFYGIVQSGSHLLWHLSGTLFSNKEENSIPYSTVNILMVGIRGAIAPLISYVLCKSLGPSQVMLLGSICCFIGFFIMKLYTNIEKSINQSCLN